MGSRVQLCNRAPGEVHTEVGKFCSFKSIAGTRGKLYAGVLEREAKQRERLHYFSYCK